MTGMLDLPGFTIKKKLGTGARSIIYMATDDETGKDVALKRVLMEQPEDIRIFEQVENEFKVAKAIENPYIRKCYRLIKRRKFLKVNELVMTMEMFEGVSLENAKTLSLIDVMLVFRMVSQGLSTMHQHGFVHCDIKPNNILIRPEDGKIMIIDLGQSCKIGVIKERIQGTPDYIAPEQVRKEPISHRTDIFNLGATMYWALTGKNVPTLIPQKSDLGMMASKKEFPTPYEYSKKIPIGLSNLVMDCVKDSPADRPGSMNDLTSRLDLLIQSIVGNRVGKKIESSK